MRMVKDPQQFTINIFVKMISKTPELNYHITYKKPDFITVKGWEETYNG